MIRVIIYSLAQLTIVISGFSQPVPRIQGGLGSGFAYFALKNELVSSYSHNGGSAPLQLIFRLNTNQDRHFLQLNYISLALKSTSQAIKTEDTRVGMQYAYHRKIGSTKNEFVFYAGLVLDTKTSRRHNTIDGVQTGRNTMGEITTSLSPSLYIEKSIRNDVAGLQCWSALLTYAVQSGYTLSNPEKMDMLGPGEFKELDTRIFYNKFLTSRIVARVDYQFQVYKISKYETVSSLSHQVVFSLLYNLIIR